MVDDSRLYRFVEDLRAAIAAASAPTQIAIVVGGGNIHRGPDLPRIRRTESDRLGMIGTLFNANVVAEYCDLVGLKSVVMSASFAPAFGEYYSVSRCLRFWEDGYVIVFGCGLGVGGFTTDTAAAQRAYDLGADALLCAKFGTDGVYTADPNAGIHAIKYDVVSHDDVLTQRLAVMDFTAVTFCRDHNLPIYVFDMLESDAISAAIQGEWGGGTLIGSV